jgi:RNA polymerase sigma factor (sigma-70 family)
MVIHTKASIQLMEKELIEILNLHRGLIYKVCNLYCADQEDRKDLFQEIVLQVWKSLPRFRHESALSTWMYRIALNTAITHFKKETRSNNYRSITGIDIPDLSDGDEREELMKQMFAAIDGLDKIDKSIILLHLEEKSYEEISEIIGISKSNVGVKLNRIKTRLSNALNK